ncbi:MAG: PilZ domain-containing protein [Spirochaetes bacterium]|nr:PilZ domain-containing protein [Spirochaetota bacterium]MBN2770084.1 PilZ domain-containing protein [Spirochaetota bacterium]
MKKLKYIVFERRRRNKRPFLLKLFTMLILFIPAYYYAQKIIAFDFFYQDYHNIIAAFSNEELVISLCAIIIIILLLIGIRIGFYLVLVSVLLFVFYQLYLFFITGQIFNFEPVFMSFGGAAFFIYMTSPDNIAPFVRRRTKGFRRELRRTFNHTVVVDNKKKVIENISSRGMLLRWKDSGLKPCNELELSLVLNRHKFEIKAGIVWSDSDVVALAFRSLDRSVRDAVYLRLKHLEEKRSNFNETV